MHCMKYDALYKVYLLSGYRECNRLPDKNATVYNPVLSVV